MIIYNVTIKADNEIATDYLRWLKEDHIPEVMDTGLFAKHHIYHLLEQDETEGVTYVVQYFCERVDEYNKYILEYAPAMREKGFKLFGNKFAAFRTIMETAQFFAEINTYKILANIAEPFTIKDFGGILQKLLTFTFSADYVNLLLARVFAKKSFTEYLEVLET